MFELRRLVNYSKDKWSIIFGSSKNREFTTEAQGFLSLKASFIFPRRLPKKNALYRPAIKCIFKILKDTYSTDTSKDTKISVSPPALSIPSFGFVGS
ncbi:hypothetical protein SAMN04487992_107213 [Cellulophaga baltica]|uniref:Uncharacterized protein n=1 Tax=Cellulophaga baltica TaxID=76594 RepID=A0A1G7IFS7_9FLAO|nr:hypothetical protein SAMN04487992_107213 [Cellulophaga baltica]